MKERVNTLSMRKQTRAGSFVESLIAALLAAPTAQVLHWYILSSFGNNLSDPQLKVEFLQISWVSFFIHSIVWKYILRRLFTKYGWEPKQLLQKFKYKIAK